MNPTSKFWFFRRGLFWVSPRSTQPTAPGTLNSILKQAQLKADKKNQEAEEVKQEEIKEEEEN